MTDLSRAEKLRKILIAHSLSPPTIDSIFLQYRELESRARQGRAVSPITKEIAALLPGQFCDTIEVVRQNLSTSMKTARRMLADPSAQWSTRRISPGVVRITRVPIGYPLKRYIWTPIVLEIAAMRVGESKLADHIFSVRSKGMLCTNHKRTARHILSCPEADWFVRSTNQGVRVTRVA